MADKIKVSLVMLLVLGAIHGCKTQKPPVHGTILVPDDYSTIQEALDGAWSGDTVLVAPGTYYESVQWPSTDGIVLISVAGPESTWIRTSRTPGITISSEIGTTSTTIGSTTVISGFKISGNGGVYCYNSSPTITANTITLCSADFYGGGIYCKNSNPIINNNIISGNSTEGSGGGICCDSSSPKIIGNTITVDTAGNWGGAIYCYRSHPTISSNTISENTALCKGPYDTDLYYKRIRSAIFLYESHPVITDNNIVNNKGGIFLFDDYPETTYSTITHNCITENNDSGIEMVSSNPSVSYNTISKNGYGFSIMPYVWGPRSRQSRPQIHYNNIVDNYSYGILYGWLVDPGTDMCHFILKVDHNWWGDPSGPSGVGPGTGDEVDNECMDYTPWLISPVDIEGGTSQ